MERNALAELTAYTAAGSHPNLPKILDAGFYNKVPALLFERADFETVTLKTYIKVQKGKQRPCNTRDIVGDIVAGLAQLHKMDLLHTDIKPANILLFEYKRGIGEPLGPSLLDTPRSYFYSFLRARLSDCPLAKLGDLGSVTPESPHNNAKGFTTPCYRAPELFQLPASGGVRADPIFPTKALDAWSLGLTWFELATGMVEILNAPAGPDYEKGVAAKQALFISSGLPAVLCDLEGKLGKHSRPKLGTNMGSRGPNLVDTWGHNRALIPCVCQLT
jgi:serine/threonine protein kinase